MNTFKFGRLKSVGLFALLFLLIVSSCRESEYSHPNNLKKIHQAFIHSEDPSILIAAHRAAHNIYPENSLAAIRHTIAIGADFIEIDTRCTSDGKVILMHDGSVDRTTNGKGKVKSLTFAQVRALKLKDSDEKHIYKVPTFREALDVAKGNIMVDIDMKSAPVSKLVEIVHQMDMGDQVIFFDSDFAVLDSVKLLDTTLMVMPRAHSAEKLEWMLNRYHPPVIHIDPGFYTPEVVRTIKDGSARIWINALGKSDILAASGMVDMSYGALIEGGANIIQTDRPAALLEYFVKRKRHW